MGSNRGVSNRRRHDEFMSAWDEAGLSVTSADMHRFDTATIDLSKLHTSLRSRPAASLLVGDVVYVCRHEPLRRAAARASR